MKIEKFKNSYLKETVDLYNKYKVYDSDFRPLSKEEFYYKYISIPYLDEKFLLVAKEKNKLQGFLFADVDKLVEKKFNKKIAIINLLLANIEKLNDISRELIKFLIKKLKEKKVEEIQAYFIDEKFKEENEFYKSEFELKREWYYMEKNLEEIKTSLNLPKEYKWEYLKIKGKNSNAISWINCYNESFKDHFGMRPLRYEEIKSYYKEKEFDPKGYFGIIYIKTNQFIAECSCEIDPIYNEFKKVKRGIIWTLGVMEKYRRKGFGKLLLLKAIKWLKEKKMEKAAIHVDKENMIALKLYKENGFEILRKRLFYSKEL